MFTPGIQLINESGHDFWLPAELVRDVVEHPIGSRLTLTNGQTRLTTSSVAAVNTAIDTLWDEYIESQRPSDYLLEQALGNYAGQSVRRKFGHNPAVSTSAEVISILSTASYAGFLTAATTVRIKAGGDGNDTAAGSGAQAIVVEGLDDNFDVASEAIATAGASASSATTASFRRVHRAYVTNVGTYHGSNVAAITIENSGGGTDLVQIGAAIGQTEIAVDTVPAGYTDYLSLLQVDADSSKAVTVSLYQCQDADDVSTPFTGKRLIIRLSGVTGHVECPFTKYVVLPEKTDVWAEGIVAATSAEVTVGFSSIRIAN